MIENRVHNIIKLDTGLKYVILKQAIYKGETYYIVSKLDDEEKPLPSDISFFHQLVIDKKLMIEEVTDIELIKYLYSYMQF